MSMIAPATALSFTAFKPLQPRLVTPSDAERAEAAATAQADKPKSSAEIFGEMAAHLKEQEAVKAHTVFKSGGKIVGVLYQDGSAVYPSGGAGSGVSRGSLGLGAYADTIGAALKKSYGAGVTTERWKDGDAPTQGQLSDTMFRSQDRLGSYRFLDALAGRGNVAFDTATLEAMSGL